MSTVTRCNDNRVVWAYSGRRNRHRSQGGFTLVELLVVVAILALLISILLPSLNKAKDAARAVVCQTNLKNIALATILYSYDYNDWVHAAYTNTIFDGIPRPNKTWCDVMRELEFLPELDNSNKLSYCPNLETPKAGENWNTYSYGQRHACIDQINEDGWQERGWGYFNLAGSQVRCWRIRDREFFYPYTPAEFVLFADTIAFSSDYTTWQQVYTFPDNNAGAGGLCRIEMRHFDKANCGFGDGHVEAVGRTELNNRGFRDSNRLWPPP